MSLNVNLSTNRSLLKFLILGFLTFGIYSIWITARSGEDLNIISSSQPRTMNFWLLFLIVGPLTLGVGSLVWWHRFSAKIGREFEYRGLRPKVTAFDFWLWGVLGTIILIGPLVFTYKWLHAMNDLSA